MDEPSAPQPAAPEPPGPQPAASSEAKQAGVLVWGKITASLSEILAPLIVIRILGKGEVGAVTGLLLIYMTLATVVSAGFPRATLYFLADRPLRERRAIVGQLMRIMGLLSVAMAALMALGGWLGADLLHAFGDLVAGSESREDDELVQSLRYLPILGLYALVDLPTRLLPNILVAEKRARAAAGFGVVRSLVTTVAIVLPASLDMGVLGIVVAMAVTGLIPFAVCLQHLRKLYAKAEKLLEPVISTRELLRYALPLGVTDMVSILNTNVDMWLIVALFPAELVAVYRAGAFQIPIITTVAYSLGAVYLPRFAKLYREANYKEAVEIWRGSALKVSLIVVPAASVFFVGADEFITMAFTEEYAAAAPVFRFYCLLMMARITAFGSFMVAAGKPEYVMRSAMMTLVSNVVISVPLTLNVGFIGPAMGTAIAFVPTTFFYCWYIAKAWNVRLRETLPLLGYLRVVAIAAGPGAAAWWLKEALSLPPALEFLIVAAVIMVGFAALGTATKLISREDWAFAWSWARLKVLKDED